MNLVESIRVIGISTIAILLTMTGLAAAAPKPTACTSSISSCGCTITQTGTFTVVDDLDASQGPDCWLDAIKKGSAPATRAAI